MSDNNQPFFGQILDSDWAYSYLGLANNITIPNLSAMNPSQMWEQIQYDPWLAMIVFQDMELKDDMISSTLETRKEGVLAKPRHVLPASDKRQDKKIAEFVDETLNDFFNPIAAARGDQSTYFGFEAFLWELLDAVGKGVSIGEIDWEATSDRIYCENVIFHPQHIFSFSENSIAAYSTPSYLGRQTGPLRLRSPIPGIKNVGEDGKLPRNKFVVGTYKPRYSNRWGTPQLLKAFWMSWFKRMGLKQMLRYVEKGSGSVVARYPDGSVKAVQNQALEAAAAVTEEPYAALPSKFVIELLQHVRASIGEAPKQLVDDLCNNGIARVILGQTLTSKGGEGGGGARALGDVHNQVRGEKIESDSKFLMQVVNRQLVYPIVFYNFGPTAKLPTWGIQYNPKADLSADSIWHTRVVKQLGLPIAKKFFYGHYELPEPSEGEEVLEPQAQGEKPSLPSTGVDSAADFAEKKTLKLRATSDNALSLKMERFKTLHPSTMKS